MKLAQYLDLLLLTAGAILITCGLAQLGLSWLLVGGGTVLVMLGIGCGGRG